ncbi:MAG: hypothetical protein GWN87_23600 [Desulfuromonadales bacterium]|nr:hypothetical protein [Desulfuromonadales bacterium]NIS42840.1 hypothetical protein [Desulfuromonadales bacterium]
MSDSELIETLRYKGEQRVRALWTEAEDEAERLQTEKEARLEKAREEIAQQLEQAEQSQARERLQQALEKSREIVLDAEHVLASRCYKLAAGMLGRLGGEDRRLLLRKLAEEIPEASWARVSVNPLDRDAASRLFPQAEIVTDEAISAGLAVSTAGGRIEIDNTLEKRLQRLWPALLPELMQQIRGKLDVQEPSQEEDL